MPKPKTIDEYIAKKEGTFAFGILTKIDSVIHETEPDIEEAIKWGAPSYEYKGLMISTVAFKNFVAVWFHMGAFLDDPKNLLEASSDETKYMRKYIIPSLDELDEEGLKGLISEAVKIQESGQDFKTGDKSEEKFPASELLDKALHEDPKAKAEFDRFTNYKKKEFIEHIESAKREETRKRRLEKSLELIREGIGLHDKYR